MPTSSDRTAAGFAKPPNTVKVFFSNLNKQAKAILGPSQSPKVLAKPTNPKTGLQYRGLSFKRTRKEASIGSSGSDRLSPSKTPLKKKKKSKSSPKKHARPTANTTRRIKTPSSPSISSRASLWRASFFSRSRFCCLSSKPLQRSLSQLSLTLQQNSSTRRLGVNLMSGGNGSGGPDRRNASRQPKGYIREPFQGLPPLRPSSPVMTVVEIEDIVNYMQYKSAKHGGGSSSTDTNTSNSNKQNHHIHGSSHQRQHHKSNHLVELPKKYYETNKGTASLHRRAHVTSPAAPVIDEYLSYNNSSSVLARSIHHRIGANIRYPPEELLIEALKSVARSSTCNSPAAGTGTGTGTENDDVYSYRNTSPASADEIYWLANAIANHRIKERRMTSQFDLLKARKREKSRYDAYVRVRIQAYQDLSNPRPSSINSTSTTGTDGPSNNNHNTINAYDYNNRHRYNYTYFNGPAAAAAAASMDPMVRIERINATQNNEIIEHTVFDRSSIDTPRSYASSCSSSSSSICSDTSLSSSASTSTAASSTSSTTGNKTTPTSKDEQVIHCKTSIASYHLMRPSCAVYMNRTFQGYGTYLPRGQFMANLILLNKQGRRYRMLGRDPDVEGSGS